MYRKENDFDKNNKKRIYNLLVLKGEALIKGQVLELKKGTEAGENYCNFFTAISNQIDTLLVYFINDEISACLFERGPLETLRDEAIEEYYKEEDFKRIEVAKLDLYDLFASRTDYIIGSNILDFKISTYSAFEKYVCELYEILIAQTPRSNKKELKLIKLIESYNLDASTEKKEALLKQIKKINFYVSGSEKINYVLSKCHLTKEELKEKREFLDFYRNQRNTIHNLGYHGGNSDTIFVEGIDMRLDNGQPSYTSDRNSAFYACRKLMYIYQIMLSNVLGILVL